MENFGIFYIKECCYWTNRGIGNTCLCQAILVMLCDCGYIILTATYSQIAAPVLPGVVQTILDSSFRQI